MSEDIEGSILRKEITSRAKKSDSPFGVHPNVIIDATSDPQSKFLSLGKVNSLITSPNPPMVEFIQSGILPHVIRLMKPGNEPDVQLKATLLLNNVVGLRGYVQIVLELENPVHIVLPWIVGPPNFSSAHQELALDLLGNLAGEGLTYRNMVLSFKFLPILNKVLVTDFKTCHEIVLKSGSFLLQNLCLGGNVPMKKAKQIVLILAFLATNSTDEDVLLDVAWGLSYISDGSNEYIQLIMEHVDLISRMIELMSHPIDKVRIAAVCMIANVTSGSDKQTDEVVKAGGLEQLKKKLMTTTESINKRIKKECVWAISNIMYGTTNQIQYVIHIGIVEDLVKIALGTRDPLDVRRDACWAITHGLQKGSTDQEKEIIRGGAIPALATNFARETDDKFIRICLEGFEKVVFCGEKTSNGKYLSDIIHFEGVLAKVNHIKKHGSAALKKRFKKLFNKFQTATMHLKSRVERRKATALLEIIQTSSRTSTSDPHSKALSLVEVNFLLASKNPPMVEFIQSGMLPHVIRLMKPGNEPVVQKKAAYVVNNVIATNGYAKFVLDIENPVQIVLLWIIGPPDFSSEHQELALDILANLAGESLTYRNMVLSSEVLPILKKVFVTGFKTCRENMLNSAGFLLSNLCHWGNVSMEKANQIVPILAFLARNSGDALERVYWGLSYISDGGNEYIQLVLEHVDLIPRMIDLMSHPVDKIKIPALRVIGNVATGNHNQTEVVVKAGALERLKELMTTTENSIVKKECVFTISNIMTGTTNQIQYVIHIGIVEDLVEILLGKDPLVVRMEALWAITNGLRKGSTDQRKEIIRGGAIPALATNFVRETDVEVAHVCLVGLEKVVRTSNGKYLSDIIHFEGVLVKVDHIKKHESTSFKNRFKKLFTKLQNPTMSNK